ncbi:MAG: hypothetical protein AB2693_19320 [Candidatus Thiodiazotropha sp.]
MVLTAVYQLTKHHVSTALACAVQTYLFVFSYARFGPIHHQAKQASSWQLKLYRLCKPKFAVVDILLFEELYKFEYIVENNSADDIYLTCELLLKMKKNQDN